MAESAKTTIEKLNSRNYQIWKYKLELLLIKEDLWDIVTGTQDTSSASWIKKDGKARATIGLLVEDGQLVHIKKCKTSKEAWESLRNYHEKATLTNKVFMLKRLCNIKLSESGDMEAHIDAMTDTADMLTALGESLPEHLMVAFLLCSLPDSYSTLITALETRPEADLTLGIVKERLLHEDKRRKESRDKGNDRNTVLRTISIREPRPTNRVISSGDNMPRSAEKICYYCKKPGHFKRECRKLIANKRKAQYDRHGANTVTDDKQAQGNQELPQQSEYCFSAIDKTQANGWYMDSGATCHMSNDRDFFVNMDTTIKEKIYLANGNCIQAIGKGHGYLELLTGAEQTKKIMVKNVLFVPELETNLLSVRKLTAEGLLVTFQGNKCNVIKDNQIIATANQNGQLYELNCRQRALSIISNRHSPNCIHLWHRRMGHRDPNAVKELNKNGLALGITISDCKCIVTCTDCIKGKLTRKPFPKSSTSRTANKLDLVHTDICGPMATPTPSGKRYFLTMIDDFSRYTIVYLLTNKSEATERIREYIQMVSTQFQRKPKIIRSDGGGEYLGNEIKQHFTNEGIIHQITSPYSPQQNGTAERKNRSLCEMTRCMLGDAGLHNRYWGEAIITANYIQNRLPTKACERTPFELWNDRKPHIKHMRIFGATAYMHIPDEKRRKLDTKAIRYIMVGYQEGTKAYRLLDTDSNKIHISRDVKFIETLEDSEVTPESHSINQMPNESPTLDIVNLDLLRETTIESVTPQTPQKQTPRRSQRSTKGIPPARYAHTAITCNPEEPRSRQEAIEGPYHHEWVGAMDDEIKSLQENQAWELVKLPPDKHVIGSKWTFKIKTDAHGNIDRFKARLVARGFSQIYGEEYDQIFAPVVKQATLRTMLAIAGKQRLTVKHFDVKTAVLNGELLEDIYMQQPEGYNSPGNEGLVCHLKRSIYGLKQSARSWNLKLNEILLEDGFIRSNADPCLYQKTVKLDCLYLLAYVDDIIMISASVELIRQTELSLKEKFEINDLGMLGYYLGIQVDRDCRGIFHIHQSTYIQKLLNRFGLEEAKTSALPMDPAYIKLVDNGALLPDNQAYRQAIGALLYIATNTRPDIMICISILSRKNIAPTQTDWTEVKRVLRYLKGTINLKLSLGRSENEFCHDLQGFADADWAGNVSDRRSNSGFVFTYLGGTIGWGSRRQPCVALSSTEAEYIALSDATREVKWLRELLNDLKFKPNGPTVIYEDNQGCLKLLESDRTNSRTKHIDIRFHFIRESKLNGEINVVYCPTDQMTADLLTKPLNSTKLKQMLDLIGLHTDLEQSLA